MERIPEFLEAAELSELNENTRLLFFPIRHHSPVCSYQLKKTAERFSPDIILIEGPSDANELIPVLTAEDTVLPAAIYYFYKDKKKLVSEDAEDHRCYYPFVNSSPELNALKLAKELGIKARFIDLPYCEILINTAETKGLRKSGKQNYADDSRLTSGELYRALCEKTGIRTFEEFWEKHFEISGLTLSPQEFLNVMHTYCLMIRNSTSDDEIKLDGTAAREQFMAEQILSAMKEHSKVMVVTGGFHSAGLFRLVKTGNVKPFRLHKIADDCKGCYPAAYSYEAADALRGYASGMPYPYFYDMIFERISARHDPSGAYDEVTLDLLVRTAKESSKQDLPVAISDVTAAQTMMSGLAALRNIRESGIYELTDGVTSSFIKGEKTIASSLPLDILARLARGDSIGHIGDKTHTPPLISDFEHMCEVLRLKHLSSMRQNAECALFTSAKGLPLSRFFHMMSYLGTGFCTLVKGADLRTGRDRNRVREEWVYQRTPQVDAVLIDHIADGFTVEEACRTLAMRSLRNERRCERAAGTAVDCFMMNIPIEGGMERLADITSSDGDFFSVGMGMQQFETLYRLRKLYKYEDESSFKLIELCWSKLIAALPTMADVPNEQADKCITIMKRMGELSDTILPDRKEGLISALKLLIKEENKQPAVYGAALGLLSRFDISYEKTAELAMKGYLAGSLNIKKQGADFLKGLFSSARDIVFAENDFLRMADELITGMDKEDFLEVLPQLRLAFGYFTPQEIRRTAAAVASIYGESGHEVLYGTKIDEAVFELGRKLDSEILQILEGGKG